MGPVTPATPIPPEDEITSEPIRFEDSPMYPDIENQPGYLTACSVNLNKDPGTIFRSMELCTRSSKRLHNHSAQEYLQA